MSVRCHLVHHVQSLSKGPFSTAIELLFILIDLLSRVLEWAGVFQFHYACSICIKFFSDQPVVFMPVQLRVYGFQMRCATIKLCAWLVPCLGEGCLLPVSMSLGSVSLLLRTNVNNFERTLPLGCLSKKKQGLAFANPLFIW